ncbi:MAG: hypothetical protein HYS25_17250 [Ignavibacteriales bacterium]|nr:hypothetical protein [Ignavibacteriales bacterium]
MTKEKLMRALMISSSANPYCTKLLLAFPANHFHSVETLNKNIKEIFGIDLTTCCTHALKTVMGVKSPTVFYPKLRH